MTPVRVGRRRLPNTHRLLSEVNMRDNSGDVGVSLGTVVDGRSRHCEIEEEVVLGKQGVSD